MTFAAILADVYRRLLLPVTPSSADTTRLKAFVNETHRDLLTSPGLDRLRDDAITFNSVAAQAQYSLGQAVARIKSIYMPTTNLWRLQEMSLNDLRRVDPGLTATGNPEYWVPIGYAEVSAQPAVPTGIWAVSTAAGDTSQTVHIEGTRTGAYFTGDQSALLTGTARVQIGTFTDIVNVDKFYLSAVGVGSISLYDAVTAGNELARIPIGFTAVRNFIIQLYPTPQAVIALALDYTRKMLDMVQDDDEPFVPADFHDLLSIGCRMKEYEYRSDERLPQMEKQFAKRRSDLFQWVQNPPDYRPVPGATPIRESNLGGFYPPGVW